MAARDRPHIFLREQSSGERYTSPVIGRGPKRPPAPQDPDAHASRLRLQYGSAQPTAPATSPVAGAVAGFTIELSSVPGFVHKLDGKSFFGLGPSAKKPELKAVRVVETPAGDVQVAVVFVPIGAAGAFLKALDAYVGEPTTDGNHKQADLVERIESIRRATIRGLWTDDPALFPEHDAATWWEVWLRNRGGEVDRLEAYCELANAEMSARALRIDDRTVVLVRASATQLAGALDVLDDLVELRKPAEHLGFLTELAPAEQADWVTDLAGRLGLAGDDAPVVCLLDTGVERAHPLLEGSLDHADCHVVDPSWGVHDVVGHGTQMAGVALFGDLAQSLLSSGTEQRTHRLESVKAFQSAHTTQPQAYGAVTAEAVSRPEVTAPARRRAFSMAITAGRPTSSLPGEPTSWSATLDALAAGRSIATDANGITYLEDSSNRSARMIVVSAGSTLPPDGTTNHLDWADATPIEDPAQAWNAVTVGAYTDLHDLTGDPSFAGWTATALPGELSPFSSTGAMFAKTWPHKPDVVAEGGNAATSSSGADIDTPSALQLLTTGRASHGRLLWTTHGTSPATAAVAGIAADIWAAQPELWPETVRALIVHSASWSPRMLAALAATRTQATKVGLLRRYGWGIPSLTRALRSATDALTLVAEDTIRPFADGKTDELRLHQLPWPTDVLRGLGEAEVRLRVTLSYFVDPNPSRRGWRTRFAYQSHGLRFAVKRETDSLDGFRKRINKAARAEGEKATGPTETGWVLGSDGRTNGSLHADLWTGPAALLADRASIAVYPVGGWWKDQPTRDHSADGVRYALIVSIETEPDAADIWSPVAAQVGIPITV